MPPAARLGDHTSHPGLVAGPGVPTVLIGHRPAAATGDVHACALPPNAGPHPPTTFAAGSRTVMVGGRFALRVRDVAGCGASIATGESSVPIGG